MIPCVTVGGENTLQGGNEGANPFRGAAHPQRFHAARRLHRRSGLVGSLRWALDSFQWIRGRRRGSLVLGGPLDRISPGPPNTAPRAKRAVRVRSGRLDFERRPAQVTEVNHGIRTTCSRRARFRGDCLRPANRRRLPQGPWEWTGWRPRRGQARSHRRTPRAWDS